MNKPASALLAEQTLMHTAHPSNAKKTVSDKDIFPLKELLCIALLVNAQTPFLYYQTNAPLTSIGQNN
jgi:hypothetical protein